MSIVAGQTQAGDRPDRWWHDAVGVLWVVLAGLVLLLPALVHGGSLGAYDWLTQYGLLQQPVPPGLNRFNGDQITQMIPWTSLAWSQVHQGHLPLWNPYSALGTPLAFNWQSSTFSLPAMVGYLAPQRFDYSVQLVATLAIGGTGAYFLCRVLRLGVVPSAFAGVTFELCGTFFGWLGWPVAGVLSWTGWLFGAGVLIVRGRRRVRSVVLFSVVLALAVYAGQPDTLVLLGLFFAVFLLALVIGAIRAGRSTAHLVRAVLDLGLGALAGLGLAAPLLLPGLQLLSRSSRTETGAAFNSQLAVPLGHISLALFPGINGWPIPWSRTYIGVVAVVLAALGIVFHRRKPAVVAMIVVAATAAAVTFIPAVITALNGVPGLKAVRFPRAFAFLEFAVAVLAGVGVSRLTTSGRRLSILRIAGLGFAGTGVVALVILIVSPTIDALHVDSLVWALAGAIVGVAAVALVTIADRRPPPGRPAGATDADGLQEPAAPVRTRDRVRPVGRLAALLLLTFETVFLVSTSTSAWSGTSTPFATTPAVRALQRAVGSSLVGLGNDDCTPATLGIPPNANIAYGVHELWVYDPMLPKAYYTAWAATTAHSGGVPAGSTYCPAVTSVAAARRYGVAFILEPRGTPGPPGTVLDTRLGDESLFRVPGAAQATLTPLGPNGGLPPGDAPGTAVEVDHAVPNRWQLQVRAAAPSVLRLRLTASPGWSASIDGHPIPLTTYSGIMLQARVPAGSHVVKVVYWPKTFTLGIACALVSALGLAVAVLVASRRRRKERTAQEAGVVAGPDRPSSPTSAVAVPPREPVMPGSGS